MAIQSKIIRMLQFYGLWIIAVLKLSRKVLKGFVPDKYDFLGACQPMLDFCIGRKRDRDQNG